MCYWSIALLLFWPSLTFADDVLTPRTLDPVAAQTLARALEQSPLVRTLVREIEASNVVVHIQFSWELPAGIGGTTRFVTGRGGYRYVRISLSARLLGNDRVAILGHELQHALEVARSRAADRQEVRELFERTGFHPGIGHDLFETNAALQIEMKIRQELRARPALTAGSAAPSSSATPSRGAHPVK